MLIDGYMRETNRATITNTPVSAPTEKMCHADAAYIRRPQICVFQFLQKNESRHLWLQRSPVRLLCRVRH